MTGIKAVNIYEAMAMLHSRIIEQSVIISNVVYNDRYTTHSWKVQGITDVVVHFQTIVRCLDRDRLAMRT